jgi:hypothetical protein
MGSKHTAGIGTAPQTNGFGGAVTVGVREGVAVGGGVAVSVGVAVGSSWPNAGEMGAPK